MAAPPQRQAAHARSLDDAARDKLLASLSRELRLCLDADGTITLADGAWHPVLGIEPRSLQGQDWTAMVSPDYHSSMRDAIARALGAQAPQPEVELQMEAGNRAPALVHWTLAPGPGRHAIVAVGREPSDAELQHRVGVLEEHSRAMDGFAAIAAHQLAEPLIVAESSAILIADELDDVLTPDLRARLDGIGNRAARARQVVDALLMDARARTSVTREPVEVEPVVRQVLEDLAPRMRERHMLADVGPLPTVTAERRLLAVIYENLLSNALKYGPRDGGRIDVRAEEVDGGWRLSVASEGKPLTELDRARIFEPFRRLPGERRAPGSGLGLAICARLVQRLGGAIDVEPGPHGNTFHFVLPAA
jgi:signal transduction histidine kinase